MLTHDPEAIAGRILATKEEGSRRTQPVTLGPIDAERQFLPAEYTQLFYTPLWPDLDREHRLRYAQLYALRTNEVIMLFERFLVHAVLPPMARCLEASRLPVLRRLLLVMLREEAEHDVAFAALNRASRPDLYRRGDFFFFSPSAQLRAVVAAMGVSARRLAYPLWLLFFIEESSLALARDLAAIGDDHALGPPEPSWVAVHQEHTHDERRHTLIDRLLFEHCYADRGRLTRRLDAWLFRRILQAIFFPHPGGAGVQVVGQLVRDCPELAGLQPSMVREVIAVGHNPAFRASLLSQRLAPRAWKLFHRCPELDLLADWIPDYA